MIKISALKHRRCLISSAVAIIALLSSLSFRAHSAELAHTIVNPNTYPGDIQFGNAVALSGGKLLVGVSFGDVDGINQNKGSAYLFEASTGMLLQTFIEPNPSFGSFFGSSVALDENEVVIGAPANYVHPGRAHLFDLASGSHVLGFESSNPNSEDFFGISVGVSDNTVLVGALDNLNLSPLRTGSAYLFDSYSGNILHRFFNDQPDDLDQYGRSVAIANDKVVIGAFGKSFPQGKAYLYDASSGNKVCDFANPNGWSMDINRFGYAVAVSGAYVVIRSYNIRFSL